MRKEIFMRYRETHHHATCRECRRILPLDNFAYRGVRNDDTGVCRACEWIARHGDRVSYKDYSFDVVEAIIRFVFESDENNRLINVLQQQLNLTLDEIIDILQHLKIGNKSYKVRVSCECCGKDVVVHTSKYLSNNYIYCSNECYWSDKSNKIAKGSESEYYNRIHTHCTNCGRSMYVIPSQYNIKNRFNDNHNFCCRECYWEYRSKYYVGDKSNAKFMRWTDELRDKIRDCLLIRMARDDRLNTKPQIIVNSILDDSGIQYCREYKFGYYAVDNYLSEHNLIIEVMGDYWHANPQKYNKDKYPLNSKQLDGIHRDKLKHSYIFNHYGINILYLWEYDVVNRGDLCEVLISKYIEQHGVLENYHSFNYDFVNNELGLKRDIIIPYQEQSIENYRKLSKIAT